MLGVLYFLWRIERSRIGDASHQRPGERELAKSIGIDTMKSKVFRFSVSGALTGLAGAFYAHYILFISPVTFTISESINMLAMVIFGGMSTLFGPVLGAICLTVLPEFLRMAGELRLGHSRRGACLFHHLDAYGRSGGRYAITSRQKEIEAFFTAKNGKQKIEVMKCT